MKGTSQFLDKWEAKCRDAKTLCSKDDGQIDCISKILHHNSSDNNILDE